MARFTIIFSNSVAELDRLTAETEQELSAVVSELAAETVLAGGDTIRIIDNQD